MSGEKQSGSQESESGSSEEGPGGLLGLIASLSGVILKIKKISMILLKLQLH